MRKKKKIKILYIVEQRLKTRTCKEKKKTLLTKKPRNSKKVKTAKTLAKKQTSV